MRKQLVRREGEEDHSDNYGNVAENKLREEKLRRIVGKRGIYDIVIAEKHTAPRMLLTGTLSESK